MEHFTNIEKKLGCDIGRGNGLHPEDDKWRVGKEGFNKNLRLESINRFKILPCQIDDRDVKKYF
tara:strand:- start:106 stop:297 length:192 start_codon:yes stop_codon:yes gene_type:complete